MAPVAVTLLGGFEFRVDGALRDLPGQKDRALLAILALAPGTAHSRDKLATLLWSDRGDPHARDSLKHALARLRAGLDGGGPRAFVADRQSVRLEASALSAVMERLRRFDPLLRIASLPDWFPIRRPEDLARWAEGLRRAGLPE